MKKLSLILILAAVILGVYGCSENATKPVQNSDLEKIESAFVGYDRLASCYYSDFDKELYAVLLKENDDRYFVFSSKDEGKTWSYRNSFPSYLFDTPIEQDPLNKKFVYGKNNYIFSLMRGKLYRFVNNSTDIIALDAKIDVFANHLSADKIFIDEDGAIYSSITSRSDDNGNSWNDIGMNLYRNFNFSFINDELFIDNKIYCQGITSGGRLSYFNSTDKGQTWSQLVNPFEMYNDSIFFHLSIEDVADGKTTPLEITKPKEGYYKSAYLNNNLLIINWMYNYRSGLPIYGYNNVSTSDNYGKTLQVKFKVDAERLFFTKSGYIYANTMTGIFRNKTPLK